MRPYLEDIKKGLQIGKCKYFMGAVVCLLDVLLSLEHYGVKKFYICFFFFFFYIKMLLYVNNIFTQLFLANSTYFNNF